jgi:ribosomal protein S18 acetylase RimI-like enzyme
MIEYVVTSRLTDAIMAKGMLEHLEAYYPDFGYWYVNKCMPGIMTGNDKLLVAKDAGRIIGVALGKLSDEETKLRCIRVLPEYQHKGIGIHLTEKMLRQLNHDKPLCTVSEEMFHQFSRPFINLFDFDVTKVEKGMYRPNMLEYVFNGERQ